MLLPDMNLLPALDALLREGSVTGAATVMNVSPSAMSRTLARLRRVVGDPLLVSSGRGMTLTPRARELRPQAAAALGQALAALRPPPPVDLADVRRDFVIRTNDGAAVVFGAALLARAAREAPGVRLRILPEGDEDPADLRDRVDLDLGALPEIPPDVRTTRLAEHRYMAAVRSTDRSPGRSPDAGPVPAAPLTPADFVALPHVTVSRHGRARSVIDERLAELGLERRVLATVPTYGAACFLALDTDAYAIVPSGFAERAAGAMRLAVREIPLPLPPVSFDMAWHVRHDADPAHRWLRDTLAALAGDRPEPLAGERRAAE
ncbi:putative LysR family transcriptional regulator [Actinacidiphila reveromycinica]|uniref:Putative LysR family transcriptional regulator n=1 Tax=Actinacidiphila reveromycinica TaxID=659352 RepID=A0A7U3VPL2_9ACTN|nr:LysR family transcriptional regulator [Streptomyces sp. SN-593]BBA98784.1 putative LysR family transcriptional regulator [Streptomyces sp. SN-593]